MQEVLSVAIGFKSACPDSDHHQYASACQRGKHLYERGRIFMNAFFCRWCNCNLCLIAWGKCCCHPDVSIRKGLKFEGNNGKNIPFLICTDQSHSQLC